MRLPRLSFAGQFLAFGLVVLLGGMLTIGFWIQREIKEAVTNRTAGVTSLYVNSLLAPHVESLRNGPMLTEEAVAAFDHMLLETGLARDIVAFKIWAPDGTVLYSPNRALIGKAFPVESHLSEAFGGGVVSHISDLGEPENVYESQLWDSLIETYAPVRLDGTTRPVAVAEFYQTPDALLDEIRDARLRSWGIVGLATVVMYALLAGIVGRASRVMESQRRELEENVTRLGGLLEQNSELQNRMRKAAGRAAALNEQYLRRISADLHDGPAQDVSLALLRLEGLEEHSDDSDNQEQNRRQEAHTIRRALQSAMADLRAIAAGLSLPQLEQLTPAETAHRVVADFERVTGTSVNIDASSAPVDASLPHKITIYRVLQEALANGFRHAPGASQRVTLRTDGEDLVIEVADDGPGFDPEAASGNGSLGLAGMRERVEMLGGRLDIESGSRRGTIVTAHIPVSGRGRFHA
jgi:signal transduction histidine kinase